MVVHNGLYKCYLMDDIMEGGKGAGEPRSPLKSPNERRFFVWMCSLSPIDDQEQRGVGQLKQGLLEIDTRTGFDIKLKKYYEQTVMKSTLSYNWL